MAVGGCFPNRYAENLSRTHGIRAIVDLRAESCDEEQRLRDVGIELLHLPTLDLEPSTVVRLDTGVAFVRDRTARGRRVLIHCQHGIGRSALLALCVLVEEGWRPLEALAMAKEKRAAISPSSAQYEGWAQWLRMRGQPVPSYHEFGCIAYRHLGGS